MAQIEQPGNLDRWGNPGYRLVTLILMRCGLRISDALKLPVTCVVTDGDGAPYLRYFNHKMKREALVPIDDELHEEIRGQQQQVLQRWPDRAPVLVPRPTTNLDGRQPIAGNTYRTALSRWLERCDIRDEHGQAVHLTPHQWRHTLGTRLINRDVPQEVVRRILDHDSHQMTAHYARCGTGKPPARSTSTARTSYWIRTGHWPRRPGPSSGWNGRCRHSRTATAAFPWSSDASTPTPA